MTEPIEALVSSEQNASFHRDGAVLLKGVLDNEWVELLAQGLDECYEEPDGMSSALVSSESELRIDQFPAARSEKLKKFICDSPLPSLVGMILGGPIRFYMDQMFYKPAGRLMPTPWHQDTSYYNVEGHDLVRAWISPDIVPREASLEIVKGSHLWNITYRPLAGRDPDLSEEEHEARLSMAKDFGVYERPGEDFSYNSAVMDKSLPETPNIEASRDSFDILGWHFEPGDVILFHGNVLHAAQGDIDLPYPRRSHAIMYAGPNIRYVKRPGQIIPDPVALSERNPQTGQPLSEFDDIFPLLWDQASVE